MWKIEDENSVSLDLGDGCKLQIKKEENRISMRVFDELNKSRVLFVKNFYSGELGVKNLK
jgi:hypothetical protein